MVRITVRVSKLLLLICSQILLSMGRVRLLSCPLLARNALSTYESFESLDLKSMASSTLASSLSARIAIVNPFKR